MREHADTTWPRRIFYLLVTLAAVQVAYYYPRLPATVASHFDGLGAPNDWSGKGGFFALYIAIVFMLIGVFDLMPRWSGARPRFGMKIPNRDYWLAPERIDATRAFFRRQMMLMGVAHMALAVYAIQLAIVANFAAEPRLHPSIGWALGAYFVFLAGWLIHLHRHFRKP